MLSIKISELESILKIQCMNIRLIMSKKIIYLRAIVITALNDAHFREGSLQANPLIKRSYISTTVI